MQIAFFDVHAHTCTHTRSHAHTLTRAHTTAFQNQWQATRTSVDDLSQGAVAEGDERCVALGYRRREVTNACADTHSCLMKSLRNSIFWFKNQGGVWGRHSKNNPPKNKRVWGWFVGCLWDCSPHDVKDACAADSGWSSSPHWPVLRTTAPPHGLNRCSLAARRVVIQLGVLDCVYRPR